MGQFRRLVFEYALKVKSKDEVFDEMLQLAQSVAGSGKLGDLSALRSLAGGASVSDGMKLCKACPMLEPFK